MFETDHMKHTTRRRNALNWVTSSLVVVVVVATIVGRCIVPVVVEAADADAAEATMERKLVLWTPPSYAKCIVQSDFDDGTLIIDRGGSYKLCEDITFKPNPPIPGKVSPADAFRPDFTKYDPHAYGLGFFAAIAITASNVNLYLNGHTLQQSREHQIMQRFYSNIELASAPFIATTGPHEFVGAANQLKSATNVRILGPGVIGRSAHHGIHGNDNKAIKVADVTFQDFEVAAVALNNVDDLEITGCEVTRNSRDVSFNGMFSAAHFIRPYGQWLARNYPNRAIRFADGRQMTSVGLNDALTDSINTAYNSVIHDIGCCDDSVDEIYVNPFNVIDGPCYAFLVHGKGPAVDGFADKFPADPEVCSSNIVIEDNRITNIRCLSKEIPAAIVNNTVVSDAVGAVFQFVDTISGKGIAMNSDGTYKGNVVADMQIFVAQAIHNNVLPKNNPAMLTTKNQIPPELVSWATSRKAKYDPKYRCNGDSMHHLAKGITIIRVEQTEGFRIRNNRIFGVENQSVQPFSDCTDYHAKDSAENKKDGDLQQMGNIRAVSVASFRPFETSDPSNEHDDIKTDRCLVEGNTILSCNSKHANCVIGIDVQGDSKGVTIVQNKIELRFSDDKAPESYMACRIRENVSHLLMENNDCKEKIVVNNGQALRSRHLSATTGKKVEEPSHPCPFL